MLAMETKLEIPYMYLPHRLHVLENGTSQPIEVIGIRWNDTEDYHEYQVYNEYEDEYIDTRKCKPVLRSLKSLTVKELEVIGGMFNESTWYSLSDRGTHFIEGSGKTFTLEKIIKITEYLYSVLADVNGLIEQGLAVDYNKLD